MAGRALGGGVLFFRAVLPAVVIFFFLKVFGLDCKL